MCATLRNIDRPANFIATTAPLYCRCAPLASIATMATSRASRPARSAQPPSCSAYCGMRCRATPGSESTGAGGACPAAHCTACFMRGPVPTSLFNNLSRVARPAYRWARKPEGGGGCKSAAQPCSAFAVCMSGSLRSFWSTRLNIERALLLPNGPADLFAHVYYEPRRRDHRRGLQWLRNAPYSQAVRVRVRVRVMVRVRVRFRVRVR